VNDLMKTTFLISLGAVLLSAPICAQQQNFEPLITKSKIQEIAERCKAEITVSEMPSYDEDATDGIGKPVLYVGVKRSNSPDAISCVQDSIPTVMTGMVGRPKGVPPLDKEILDDILKKCGWTKADGFVGFVDVDELQFQPTAAADYDRVDCALKGIKPYHLSKFGFVGNEQYRVEEEQK
jgi:hypothetical protein